MAEIIVVTAFNTALDATGNLSAAASPIAINVKNIISVKVRSSTTAPTGVSTIMYSVPVNQMQSQVALIVTEAVADIVTAANAAAA